MVLIPIILDIVKFVSGIAKFLSTKQSAFDLLVLHVVYLDFNFLHLFLHLEYSERRNHKKIRHSKALVNYTKKP